MEWILLEKQSPDYFGTYLVCYKGEKDYIVNVDNWNYSLTLIKEDRDIQYSKKNWSFINKDVIWWANMPNAPE